MNFCPKCPCVDCEAVRESQRQAFNFLETDEWTKYRTVPMNQSDNCLIDAMMADYRRRGLPMPQTIMISCPCRRCTPGC